MVTDILWILVVIIVIVWMIYLDKRRQKKTKKYIYTPHRDKTEHEKNVEKAFTKAKSNRPFR